TENETYAGMLLLLLLAARAGLRAARSSRAAGASRASLLVAAASMLHIASLLFLIPLCPVATQGIAEKGRRIRVAVVAALAGLLPVLAVYAGAAWALNAKYGTNISMWAGQHLGRQFWMDQDPARVALGFLWFLRGTVPDFGLLGRVPAPTSSAL